MECTGGLADVRMENILVSGPYWRAVSLAATWNLFGKDPVGSIRDWTVGGRQPVVFEQPQKPGIRSKVWATGAGQCDGVVFNIAFPGLSIGNVTVDAANRGQYFNLAEECSPESSVQNVRNITFSV